MKAIIAISGIFRNLFHFEDVLMSGCKRIKNGMSGIKNGLEETIV
jgi:hypothetical protein